MNNRHFTASPPPLSAADKLEAFPFTREITPLDLIHLPRGVFDSLPKPWNLKRTSSGSPIWPPVLTEVLINGLLLIHHKPNLVGSNGLDEHYNWLAAFVYRQTRGWDPDALCQNTVRKLSDCPAARIGIIRSRKQISSKVQTLGEHLKDTHWAYITNGPKQPHKNNNVQQLSCPEFVLGAPILSPAGGPCGSPQRSPNPLDLSHIDLNNFPWLPPTPISLPSTPNRSPFLYPIDIPNYEILDGRTFGYDPDVWDVARHRSRLRSTLVVSKETGKAPSNYDAKLSLKSAALSAHFTPKPTAGVSPSLLYGTYQISSLSSEGAPSTMRAENLSKSLQLLLDATPATVDVCYVDLPFLLPSKLSDRLYLANDIGFDYHVKASIQLSTSHLVPPRNDELEAVSEVYFIPGPEYDDVPELLELYNEHAPVLSHGGGLLQVHALAGSFAAKIWADMIQDPRGNDPDLSRYTIIQQIRHVNSHHDPLFVIIYAPRGSLTHENAKITSIVRSSAASHDTVAPATGTHLRPSDLVQKMTIDPVEPIHHSSQIHSSPEPFGPIRTSRGSILRQNGYPVMPARRMNAPSLVAKPVATTSNMEGPSYSRMTPPLLLGSSSSAVPPHGGMMHPEIGSSRAIYHPNPGVMQQHQQDYSVQYNPTYHESSHESQYGWNRPPHESYPYVANNNVNALSSGYYRADSRW